MQEPRISLIEKARKRALEHPAKEKQVYKYHTTLISLALQEKGIPIDKEIRIKISHIGRIEQAIHDLHSGQTISKETQEKLLEQHLMETTQTTRTAIENNIYNAQTEMKWYLANKITEPDLSHTYFHSTLSQIAGQIASATKKPEEKLSEDVLKIMTTPPLPKANTEHPSKLTKSTLTALETIASHSKFTRHQETMHMLLQKMRVRKNYKKLKEADLKIMLATAIQRLHEHLTTHEELNQLINTEIAREHDINLEKFLEKSKGTLAGKSI